MKKPAKNEESGTGGIAGYSMGFAKKIKTKKNRKGNMLIRKNFKEKSNIKSIKEMVDNLLEDKIIQTFLEAEEGGKREEQILIVFDSVVSQIDLSLKYAKMYLSDGIKLADKNLRINVKRTNREIDHVKKLADDLKRLAIKMTNVPLEDSSVEAAPVAVAPRKPQASPAPDEDLSDLSV